LNSHEAKEHDDIINRLNQRLEISHKGLLPPITVFPEGTLNNGETLLKFKKGSFCHTYPIKIRCTMFRKDDSVGVSYTNIHPLIFIAVLLSSPKAHCEIFEVEENIDPKWILQKHGVSVDDPLAWEIVANEIKKIMCFMTDCRATEQGFKEIDHYEKIDCYANDKIGGRLLRRDNCSSCKNKLQQIRTTGRSLVSAVKSKRI
jgi:lysophosphatidylcholine acyltransferase / lyso-PAF acetyltransferase